MCCAYLLVLCPCVHVCRGQRLMWDVLSHSTLYFLRQDLSLNLELIQLDSKAQSALLSLAPQLWDCSTHHVWLYMWLGTQTQALHQLSHPQPHLPSLPGFHPSAHGFHFLFTSRLSISPVFLFLLTSLLFFLPVCSAGNSWLQPNMCNAWRLMMSRPNTKQKQRNPSPHPTLTLRPPQLRSQAAAAQNSCF